MNAFAFGRTWRRFLRLIDGHRIAVAEDHLRRMLEVERLDGVRFLDVGSGSGLASWIDWIGGYPFEVVCPDKVFDFYRRRDLTLLRLKTTAGPGCNEFVFAASTRPAESPWAITATA